MSVIFDVFEIIWIGNSLKKSLSILDMASVSANPGIKDVWQRMFPEE